MASFNTRMGAANEMHAIHRHRHRKGCQRVCVFIFVLCIQSRLAGFFRGQSMGRIKALDENFK